MHTQEAGDFRNRLVFLVDELARVGDLLGREGRGGAEPHASGLRCDPAGARALRDQGSLELGHAGDISGGAKFGHGSGGIVPLRAA